MKNDRTVSFHLAAPASDEPVCTTIQIPYSARINHLELACDGVNEYHPTVVVHLPFDDGIYQHVQVLDMSPTKTTNNNLLAFARYIGMYVAPLTGPRHVFELPSK